MTTTPPTTIMVKNKPYFKLRSNTPRFVAKSTVSPELAAQPAPWTVPSLCAAYNWPTALTNAGVIAPTRASVPPMTPITRSRSTSR